MTLWRDLRYAVRALTQAPLFTALAVLVLAAGIGATSAIFGLLDAVILRPLPFRSPADLAMLAEASPDFAFNNVAPLNYVDWSEQNHTFQAMAAVSGSSHTLTNRSTGPEHIQSQSVTTGFFDLLGVPPVVGRTFAPSDGERSARSIVMSERLWTSHFGADPRIVGRAVSLDGEPFTVVGVVPASFQLFYTADIWDVLKPERGPEQRQMHYLRVVGRLRPGVSLDQARADMRGVAANIARISPATNKGWSVTIQPLREALMGSDRTQTSLVLGGIVGFVLLMACANVANLLLARGVGRTREMAVRAALGGSRLQLVRQLMVENLVLATLGGGAGLGLAWAALGAAPGVMPADTLPDGIALALDARVATFTLLLTMATGVLFGLVPAWHATAIPLTAAMGASSRTATHRAGRLRSALVIVEVAVAVLLLAGAGLLVRTLASLSNVDAGYSHSNVLTMTLALPNSRYTSQEAALVFYEAAGREIDALPGVRSAAWGGSLPLDGYDIGQGFTVVGDPPVDQANQPTAHYQITGTRFFETLGIPILHGRAFTSTDTGTSVQVCIVSEAFVRRFARGRDPLTLRVRVDAMGPTGPTPVVRQVVGVARQVKEDPSDLEEPVQIYVPLAQNPWYWTNLVVATAGTPGSMATAVKAAIARVDKDEAAMRMRTMEEVASQATARPRFRAGLVSAFASLALLLASIGVAGVLAFSVHQRTRELGVRAALGARPVDLLRLVLTHAFSLTAGGVALGLGGAALLSRYLASFLFGVTPLDPLTFVAAPVALGLAALGASALPAVRAARIAPAMALRQD